MKSDMFLLFLPVSFYLIYWHNTGEKAALFEQRTHSALCVLRYCQHGVSQGNAEEGEIIWKGADIIGKGGGWQGSISEFVHRQICHVCAEWMWPGFVENGMWLMEQYVFHPALVPHMSSQEQETSEWGTKRMTEWSLTCFLDLIYVNSTCRLWDRAFNTSVRNLTAFAI